MKIYIAGAISNDPDFKMKFSKAELMLAMLGYQVFNPARIAADHGLTIADPWELCMAVVIEYLYQADMLCILPDWGKSSGARLEWLSARQRLMPVVKFRVFEQKYFKTFPVNAILQDKTHKDGCYSVSKQANATSPGECYFTKKDGCYSITKALTGKCYFTVSKN